MSWPDERRCSCPLQSLVTSRIHCSLFSDWRRSVSSKFFDLQVPSISTEEFVLTLHARCVLFRLHYNGHSLLLSSYLSRIGGIENPSCSAADTRPRTLLISFCTVQLRTLFRRSLFGDSLSLYDLWSRLWRVSWLLGLPPCPHPSEGVG